MDNEHPDPWTEGSQRGLERMMALGVLIEAGSRVAAEHARAKANRDEQELRQRARHELAAREAERRAAGEQARRARQWERFAADPDRLREFLAGLPFHEVARHWGQAARHADDNATAATVLDACERDLGRRAPSLIDFYRQQRTNGAPRPEAMAAAARYIWAGAGPARAHDGRPATAGALTQIGEELDQELARLAGTLDPVARARFINYLEEHGWSAESLAVIDARLDAAVRNNAAETTTDGATDGSADSDLASGPAANGTDNAEADNAHPPTVAATSFAVPAKQALNKPGARPPSQGGRRPPHRRTR